MENETKDKLNAIKRSFRLMMNGPGAQSMREKGVSYKVNWGVPLPQLRAMAEDYGKDYQLAEALWKEDIRECKILATLIMPVERMSPELADVWMEQTSSQELAELLAFNLFQHLDFAPVMAFRWIAGDKALYQIAGFGILARLFMQGKEPDERGTNEFLDQCGVAFSNANTGVRHAALNALTRFAGLSQAYAGIARKALPSAF